MRTISSVLFVLLLTAGLSAQRPPAPGTLTDVVAQPGTWVPLRADVEEDGLPAGRFWRDRQGSTRLERLVPDADGRTILIHNVPEARYYVYRPLSGWTVQPMLLPTTGWQPRPVPRAEAGTLTADAVDGYQTHERVTREGVERRAAALNFLPLVRRRVDGVVERHRRIQVGDVPATLFVPPAGAVVTPLDTPGGIVTRPAPKGGAR